MKVYELVIFAIHLAGVFSKKKHKDISSESIENILYYKDCNHKQTPTVAPVLRSPPQQQECKMCCTMCCGDQCVDSHQMKLGRQVQDPPRIEPKLVQPIQPEVIPPRERRKKLKLQLPLPPPIAGRRGFGFTRENIKSLISQDDDIRKILKDLVRVTMQKADLMQMTDNKQAPQRNPDMSPEVSVSENDL